MAECRTVAKSALSSISLSFRALQGTQHRGASLLFEKRDNSPDEKASVSTTRVQSFRGCLFFLKVKSFDVGRCVLNAPISLSVCSCQGLAVFVPEVLQESSALASALAERWREPPVGSVVYADLTVRKVTPAALEKHLSEQPCHFPSQMSDERRSIWVWDLPFPIQIDGRRYRCRTCAANGASMRYYVITVSDLQAAFPDLLTWRDRRHGTLFFT